MSKIARRWVRILVVAAAGVAGGIALSALDSDPAAAADRVPLPAIVDRAEQAIDRVLDRPTREYPPRVLPRPPVCEDPADRPPPRKPAIRPAKPVPPRPAPGRDERPPPPAPEPHDQAPVEQPAPPAADEPEPPAVPEPARPPREPILDVPPVDLPPVVVDIPALPVPPIVVDVPPVPPLLPPPSQGHPPATPAPGPPAAPAPVPADPTPAEPAPVDDAPAPPTTPRPAKPAPAPVAPAAPPVGVDHSAVASPTAGPSGRSRPDRATLTSRDGVDPCERRIVRQGPRALPTPPRTTVDRPGRCPGDGPGTWVDGQAIPAVKPPEGGGETLIAGLLTATSSPALTRITVARARGHLTPAPTPGIDPRPA